MCWTEIKAYIEKIVASFSTCGVAAAKLNCNIILLITGHLLDYNHHWNQFRHHTHPLDGPNHQYPIKAETWG